MKFFFAENIDYIDPNFNFDTETWSKNRIPQIDDVYPHEVFETCPYDGLLVSRNIVGDLFHKGKFSTNQKYRLFREGVHKYFRLPKTNFPVIGDCGSFSYINMDLPPFTNNEIIEYYQMCNFTHGVSIDHVIAKMQTVWDNEKRRPSEITKRAEFSSRSAIEFLKICQAKKVDFTPIGAVQSWSPKSAGKYAKTLVDAGYKYIGLGGMAYQPTDFLYDAISEVRSKIPSNVKLHIFGFNRLEKIEKFTGLGIDSFDSTSPILKAFKDEDDNYFFGKSKRYRAIRIPQVYENMDIKRKVQRGVINQDVASQLEQDALMKIRNYAKEKTGLEESLEAIVTYENYVFGKSCRQKYRNVLYESPWKNCTCPICKQLGIEVIIYRGTNRNKRRGFHNLFHFYQELQRVREMKQQIVAPCIKTEQSPGKYIYSFVVNGKDISKFASVSRVKRGDNGDLLGYQRPEVMQHIQEIKEYIESDNSILPNSLVIAFQKNIDFCTCEKINVYSELGKLTISYSDKNKPGWIVDGQQRAAALRVANQPNFPISVVAFVSNGENDERQQFVLVNNTKPLPKSLIYELLPSFEEHVPSKLKTRREAYIILEKLNVDRNSPFYMRIKTMTYRGIETANIKDMSILKMLENSLTNGILFKYRHNPQKVSDILLNYWNAVKTYYSDIWHLPPRRNRLTHGVGIVSMGYLMDTISWRLMKRGKVPLSERYLDELKILGKDVPWNNGTWKFSKSMILPWNEIQNTIRHIDMVTNFLLRRYTHKN
ncbi:tRNA-guanine transglycosylase DpdA [Candidatus Uabimicrobium amorphum]|uniref:tRNA-guanine(15) transglycosylase-like domain-containing protein n=1 Tax=Uabimicrobium amorphum TaxID=2596890 RepID=A0A5S9IS33_UABAM|nr:tRNA-guanine transglycosylase DpdA [Candidatus Uabimicrobium amorphum]BBM87118.1 hypothetical protein UABAM_05521 [Candidatus Uabimicrobium amorphum]